MCFDGENFMDNHGCTCTVKLRRIANAFELCSQDFESQVLVHMNDRQVIVNLPYHVLSFIVVGDIHHFIKITLQKKTVHVHE